MCQSAGWTDAGTGVCVIIVGGSASLSSSTQTLDPAT